MNEGHGLSFTRDSWLTDLKVMMILLFKFAQCLALLPNLSDWETNASNDFDN